MQVQVERVAGGAMIRNAGLEPVPDARWLDPAWWRARGAARELAGGRGSVLLLESPIGPCVLRHYRRGGLLARLRGDRYLWKGASRTRPLREFRLLAQLRALGLPVPEPVVAGYVRSGLSYRADLVTRHIEDAPTLAALLGTGLPEAALARAIGTTLARFHAAGVWHADLNAHNILVGADGRVWLIDFDRGRLRAPQRRWREANLQRLLRSCRKIGAEGLVGFEAGFWAPLVSAWRAQLARSGHPAAPQLPAAGS